MRAPKVTVTFDDSFLKKVDVLQKDVVTEEFAAEAGSAIVKEMKINIAAGRSPVAGYGTFEPYKNPDKYPGNRKPHRPVNLSLTGTMLSHLSFRRNNGRLEIGILPDAPNKVKVIARVHNTGERDDIPKRHFIPDEGEKFVTRIEALAKSMFKKRVLEILKG